MTTASLKPGVDVRGIQPEILLAVQIAESIYRHHGYDFTVTSFVDGRHSANSLHYKGQAVDLRVWGVPEEKRQALADEIGAALGRQFDVVFEGDHVHIEHENRDP